MSADRQTIAAYEAHARAYAERTGGAPAAGLAEFAAALPEGARVLDLGCGPGDTAKRLMAQGFSVDAVDATPAMVAEARARGVAARLATFDEIAGDALYDGIWANYSLLHAPRSAMPGHLARLHRALKPGGLFHIGLKLGEGETRDALGRRYSYYTEAGLDRRLAEAGFTPVARGFREGTGQDGTGFHGIWIQSRG
ncbi:MAG: SAM-dependent methyltransferase [Rhodobacterales bacterium]|nr:MAG: SAM-dependent methyltransferase [Rhodobacterales bacterium]